MKESLSSGHLGVAPPSERTTRGTRRSATHNNNNNNTALNNNNNSGEPASKKQQKQSPLAGLVLTAGHNDSDSEGDWDVGVGNLVIDLDADLERHQGVVAQGATLPDVTRTATPTPRVTNGKMSSVEHHAVFDKGLKMKIKRKNVGKSSDVKHEIVKAAEVSRLTVGGGGGSGGVSGASSGNGTESTTNGPSAIPVSTASNSATAAAAAAASATAASTAANMPGAVPLSPMDKNKHAGATADSTNKEKSTKGRGAHKKEKGGRGANKGPADPVSNGNSQFHPAPGSTNTGAGCVASTAATNSTASPAALAASTNPNSASSATTIASSLAHKLVTGNVSVDIYPIQAPFVSIKKEVPADDPYEFNAKVEDGGRPLGFPVKKIKVEKTESQTSISPMLTSPSPVPTSDVAVETCCAATITDPDCLGPCEPGTAVTLEGIVWQETENGVLVVNVTWRGKTYVGTLLDATKHDWAPPRLNCESPTSEVDTRTPKGRGKRGRAAANPPENLDGARKLRKGRRNNSGTFMAPPSPAKSDVSSQGVKRKGKVADLDLNSDGPKSSKRCRSSSRGTPTGGTSNGSSSTQVESPALIECPEPNCSKKYKHINGLRYHQTHAHQNSNGDGGDDVKDPGSSEESGPHSPALSTKSDKATTRSKSKKAVNSAANGNHKNMDDGEEVLARSSPRNKDEAANSVVSNNTAAKSSQQGLEFSKAGKAEKKDIGESHSKKGDKSAASVPISASASSSSSSSSSNGTDDSCKTSASQMFQISGAPMGCLATSGVMAPPVSANQIIVSAGVSATTVTTQILAGTTVTAVPVSLPTGTTIVSLQQPIDAKVDGDKGKKSKGDKSDKLKGKSGVATRPIMPAPATLPLGHGQLSSAQQHGLISQTVLTSGLKPIQPKPTIMGEPSVNPALATLAKEKKTKKKKSRDKEQPGHSHQQLQQSQAQQQQSQQSQHLGKGSTHTNKDVMFIKQEDAKSESRSVIKTVPSPLKPVGDAGDPRLRDPASLPPELSKQPPVGMPGQQHPRSDSKQGEMSSTSPTASKASSDQRFARPPSSLSINSPLQVSTESRERSGEVQSPAYSDISDESAPTLENETQPSHKSKEEGDKGSGQLDGKGGSNERQAEEAMAAYGMSGMYHGYYGQPPYLIPAVTANSSNTAALGAPAQGCPGRTPPIKSTADKELDLSGKSAAIVRKDSDRDSANKLSDMSKDGSISSKPNSEDNKSAGGNSGQPLSDYQLQQQQQQQQKLMQQHQQQLQYYGGYYPGYVDPNYIRLVNDPLYGGQHDKLAADEQERKAKEGAGTDLTKDGPAKLIDSDKIKSESGTRNMPHTQSAPSPSSQGGKMQTERSSSSGSSDSKALASSKPPALISERERKLREIEQRNSAKDASLKEKQNENHQLLKENIAIKHQMTADSGRHHKGAAASGVGGGAGSGSSGLMPTSAQQYENNGLMDRHRDELQRYYMYQEQRLIEQQRAADEERRKFYDPYGHGHHVAAQQQSQQQQQHRGRPGDTPPGPGQTQPGHGARGPDHRASPNTKPSMHSKGGEDIGQQQDGARSRDSSIDSRQSLKGDSDSNSSKHGPEGAKHMKDGGGQADDKRPNASPSPRGSTAPKSGVVGKDGAPMSSMQGFHPAQYLPHAYLQAPHYPQQIAFDANHPMYRGVNPAVIGYGSPTAYLPPAHMRYHMSPGLEGDSLEKAKLLSPGSSGPEIRKGSIPGGDHPGKALELLQQHASHYNNFSGQHKIHELQELGKAGGDSRASPSKGSPDLTSASRVGDKVREVSKSPPPQRHLHTHHHTHVVGPPPPGYPLYDPYGATIMTQATIAGSAASIGHAFVPK